MAVVVSAGHFLVGGIEAFLPQGPACTFCNTRQALWTAFHSRRCWRVHISTACQVPASGHGKRSARQCCQTGASLVEWGMDPR